MLHALRGGNTGVLTGVSGHFSRISWCRRTTSARNSAPRRSLRTRISGRGAEVAEVDVVDRLAAAGAELKLGDRLDSASPLT